MKKLKRKATTYRLSSELDQAIVDEAERLGISKNSLVQMTLKEALVNKKLVGGEAAKQA